MGDMAYRNGSNRYDQKSHIISSLDPVVIPHSCLPIPTTCYTSYMPIPLGLDMGKEGKSHGHSQTFPLEHILSFLVLILASYPYLLAHHVLQGYTTSYMSFPSRLYMGEMVTGFREMVTGTGFSISSLNLKTPAVPLAVSA